MKKRVLMVSCNGLGNGGVQNVMMNIVRNLSGDYDFDMLLFTDERRRFDSEAEKYGTIYRIANKETRFDFYFRFFRILRGTYKILKNNDYSVIHCNNGFESGICLLAAKMAKVKNRIAHSHMNFQLDSGNFAARLFNLYYRFLLNTFSTKRIACSEKAGKSIFYKPFEVVVNSIDLSLFNLEKRKKREGNMIKFIHVGYFSAIKNQTFVVQVVSQLRKSISDIALTFIGFGEEYKKIIETETKNCGIEDIVEFLPSDTDVSIAMAESDYMIFPSLREGLGIVLLEAQAMGVYCFASTAVPHEADAGLCEFLDLNDGAEKWAKRILENITSEEKKEYAQNINEYSQETMCAKIKNIYEG